MLVPIGAPSFHAFTDFQWRHGGICHQNIFLPLPPKIWMTNVLKLDQILTISALVAKLFLCARASRSFFTFYPLKCSLCPPSPKKKEMMPVPSVARHFWGLPSSILFKFHRTKWPLLSLFETWWLTLLIIFLRCIVGRIYKYKFILYIISGTFYRHWSAYSAGSAIFTWVHSICVSRHHRLLKLWGRIISQMCNFSTRDSLKTWEISLKYGNF